jgi:Cu-Zn family superoxide dismutase
LNATIPLVCALLPLLAVPCDAAGTRAFATMIDRDGHTVGRARLTGVSHGVLIEIEMHGLAPGAHAIAVHAAGTCDAPAQFATAGGVFSFDAARLHGYLAKGGPRTGDLPNQYAGSDGVLHASMLASGFTLGDGVRSILDKDGAALIVHEKADDYLSQPEGKAGARVACGVIKRASDSPKTHD